MNRFPIEEPPARLVTDEFRLRPLTRADTERDYAAVMATREDLRLWEQSTWPADDFTLADDREDVIALEERHAHGRAYTYTVLDPGGDECVGCVYIFPTGARFLAASTVVPVGDRAWRDVDALVYFWVRTPGTDTGMDERLLAALRGWFASEEWPFAHTAFSVSELFAQQVDLVRRTDLTLEFELQEPGKSARYFVFG